MIKNYQQFIKESLLDKLQGPTKEEVWKYVGYEKTFDTPEEFFLEVIKDIKIRPQTKYPDSIFWEKDGEIIFQQDLKNMVLWVKYNTIWKIFDKVFCMEYSEIQELIKSMVEEHLNWKGFTPGCARRPFQ